MFTSKMRSQKGFTLVELMVVVAIIGILSAIAIPQFSTYQAKSRTSEAKLGLAALYSAEISFQGESDVFATCLFDMGFRPASHVAAAYNANSGMTSRYYTIGFAGASNHAVTTNILNNGQVRCRQADEHYRGTKGRNTSVLGDLAAFNVIPTAAAPQLFRAVAVGTVQTDRLEGDRWVIDQNKLVTHQANGY